MTMTQTLLFKDSSDLTDLAAYLTRAKKLDPAAAVKLRCIGNLVAVYVSPIFSGSLMGDGPTVLGLRTSQLATQADFDGTFDVSAILERLANNPLGSAQLSIPPSQVRAAWSGVIPPRDGWVEVGKIAQTQITSWAKEGISEVAIALPENVGASIASKVRLQIWGRAVDPELGLPAGAAFAMAGLGFMQPEEAISVFSNQNWLRLSSRNGHVLAKRSSLV
jgi:hypothetical protein